MIIYILLAVLIRLVLMPIPSHSDIFFINDFPRHFSENGILDIYSYLPDCIEKGYTYYPPLLYFIIGSSQVIFKHTSYFTMKIPYLIFDLLSAFVCYRIYGKKLTLIWLFLPLSLFTSYLFGQYRVITAFFIWLFIWAIMRKREFISAFFLGILCLLESFPLMLIVPFIIKANKKFKSFLIILATAGSLLIPLAIHSKGLVFVCYNTKVIQDIYFNSIINLNGLFVSIVSKIVLILIYLYLLRKLVKNQIGFIAFCACSLLAVYATTNTSVHYLMWVAPFLLMLQRWARVNILFFVALMFSFGWNYLGISRILFSALCLFLLCRLSQECDFVENCNSYY